MPVTPGTATRECVRVMSPSASSTLDQVCLIVESGTATCGNNLRITDCFSCGIHPLVIYIANTANYSSSEIVVHMGIASLLKPLYSCSALRHHYF